MPDNKTKYFSFFQTSKIKPYGEDEVDFSKLNSDNSNSEPAQPDSNANPDERDD